MRKVVGISQKIKRAWLDAVLDRLVKTTDDAELRTFLDKRLKDELPGKESRAKSTGIVLRIWSGIPPERVALRDRAVALLPRISGQERIWLHWGMTALAYPFFRDIAEVVGRLLALQDDFTTAQVQGRMLTTWGDRATSKEAAQKLITTLVDWEVLRSTKTKGHFLLARKMTASTPDLQLWILEALLGASAADEIEAQQLLRLPESFPFTIRVGVADLRRHEGFNIHRQGLDMDMVAIHKIKPEQPSKPSKKSRQAKRKALEPGTTVPLDNEPEKNSSSNGKPPTTPEVPNAAPMPPLFPDRVEEDRNEKDADKKVLKHGPEPLAGFLQFREMILVPDNPFAGTSAECVRQFHDGHYYGCLALAQAVIEALVDHFWQQVLKKNSQKADFEAKLEALKKKGLVKDDWKTRLDKMWANRHTFHHLQPSVETDQLALEVMARNHLELLAEMETELFGYAVQDGKIIPKHPEYWSLKESDAQVL